jgi:hypothetical protein
MSQTTIAAPARWQVDPAAVKRVAVLCGDQLTIAAHDDPRAGGVLDILHEDVGDTLGAIIGQCLDHDCGALWLLPVAAWPGTDDHPVIRAWPQRAAGFLASPAQRSACGVIAHPLSAGRMSKSLAGLIVQRRGPDGAGHGMPVGVYAPWVEDAWGLGAALEAIGGDPDDRAYYLAEGVALAAYALGTQLRFSPSYSGQQVLRRTLAHRRVEIPALSAQARDLVDQYRPTYAQWSRALPAKSLRIVKYDRNSSFVASFGEVPVGEPTSTKVFRDKCPGLYHVASFSPPRDRGAGSLPGPFRVGAVGEVGDYPDRGACWAWEPQLRLAWARGWSVAIDDGWYWPRAQVHDLGRAWREVIWHARGEAEAYGGPVGRIARAIIKRAGVAAVGRLLQSAGHEVMDAGAAVAAGRAIESLEMDDDGEFTGLAEVRAALGRSDLLQPAWWSHIIANATERLFSAVYAHAEQTPVAAYIDAVYCLHEWDAADPALAASLGKWKRESSVSLDAERVAAWNAATTANARVNLYARWAGEVGAHGEA